MITFLVSLIPYVLTIIGLYIASNKITAELQKHTETKQLEIKKLHFKTTMDLYSPFFYTLVNLLRNPNKIKTDEEKKIIEDETHKFMSDIILWGGDRTLKVMEKLVRSDSDNTISMIEKIMLIDELYFAMREDLGNDNNGIQVGMLVKSLLDENGKDMVDEYLLDKEKQQ